jgi:hypothetical protein
MMGGGGGVRLAVAVEVQGPVIGSDDEVKVLGSFGGAGGEKGAQAGGDDQRSFHVLFSYRQNEDGLRNHAAGVVHLELADDGIGENSLLDQSMPEEV